MQHFQDFNTDQKNLEDKVNSFVEFASKFLNLKEVPSVKLIPERERDMTTANYNLETKEIKVLSKNRAFFDIARSIAHEMVHQMQQENGEEMDGTTGSPCEDAANAIAGRIIRHYSKQDKDFYNS